MKKEKKLDHKRWVPKDRNEDEITTSLSDLASSASLRFLKSLRIREIFLEVPPEQWEQDKDYQEGRRKIEKLKVVNDYQLLSVYFL